MAAAMARGWSRAGVLADGVVACDAGSGRAAALAGELGGESVPDAAAVVAASELVVLATKPGSLEEVAAQIGDYEGLIISVLAGVELASLEASLPRAQVVRAMPNVCVEVCQGVVCWSGSAASADPARQRTAEALDLLGWAVEVPESALDAATAAMSCSVAYLALVAEELTRAAIDEGLAPDVARQVVARTLVGTGALLEVHGPGEISDAVASPGGATEAGLDELAAGGMRESLSSAVAASLRRIRG